MSYLKIVSLLVFAVPLLAQTPAALPSSTENTVKFHASMENVKATFGPAEPVAHVKPGGVLEANSLDCFGNALQKPGDSFLQHQDR